MIGGKNNKQTDGKTMHTETFLIVKSATHASDNAEMLSFKTSGC